MSLHTSAKLCQCIIWLYNTPAERDIRRLHLKEKAKLLFTVLKDNLATTKMVTYAQSPSLLPISILLSVVLLLPVCYICYTIIRDWRKRLGSDFYFVTRDMRSTSITWRPWSNHWRACTRAPSWQWMVNCIGAS